MQLTVRTARPDDVQLYFDWANDPATRQQSFNTNPIVWETHKIWFVRKISDPHALMLVFENEAGSPVGQVRFEQTADEVIVGVSLDAAFRGQGLAPRMLQQALDSFQSYFPGNTLPVHAYIRPDNTASVRSFERAGFLFSHESRKFGVSSLVYSANRP